MSRWLGIDGGGSCTRWAIARPDGSIASEGESVGMTAMHIPQDDGRSLGEALGALAASIRRHGAPTGACIALTGLGDRGDVVQRIAAAALGLAPDALRVITDIEATCRDLFVPGGGYVVYAGTGSVAAFLDATETLHRAGGRGVGLDDGGGGYWIAREALRAVWRREDESPGAWRQSPLAQSLFDQLGGADWPRSRDFFYGSARGEVGRLALAVARVADTDDTARAILRGAGEEIARLGRALLARYGPRPVAFAGRAFSLHPLVAESAVRGLPAEANPTWRDARSHHAAARLAATARPGDNGPR